MARNAAAVCLTVFQRPTIKWGWFSSCNAMIDYSVAEFRAFDDTHSRYVAFNYLRMRGVNTVN